MPSTILLLPNQLFADHPALTTHSNRVVLFEDPLFFGDAAYPARMHKQKLWLHRASMMRYRDDLVARGVNATIFAYERQAGATLRLFQGLREDGTRSVTMAEPVDFASEKRLHSAAKQTGIALKFLPTPGFLNTQADNMSWCAGRKRWFMAEFYKNQRRRLSILMDGDQPKGGQWSFDEDNRKKVPKALLNSLPWIDWPNHDAVDHTAKTSVLAEFPDAMGSLDTLYYPTSHHAASAWLSQFLERRFDRFGDYEDAIVQGESWLWHSVLTPALNIGLLTFCCFYR